MKKTLFTLFSASLLLSCSSIDTKSLVGNWIEVMPEGLNYVQGVTINADGSAQSIGMATLLYEKWEVDGKSMILFGKSVGNGQTIDFSDTLKVLKLSADSLILDRSGYIMNYYKVTEIPAPPKVTQEVNIIDSLIENPELGGAIIPTEYQGLLPAASCPGIDYALTIYQLEGSDKIVYKLILTYLEAEEGKNEVFTTYGRVTTLKNETTKDNTIYQLTPFDNDEKINFLLLDNGDIELVNANFEKAESKLNYTLKKI